MDKANPLDGQALRDFYDEVTVYGTQGVYGPVGPQVVVGGELGAVGALVTFHGSPSPVQVSPAGDRATAWMVGAVVGQRVQLCALRTGT